MKNKYLIIGCMSLLIGCGKTQTKSDAYGQFEATEVIVSSEATGKILRLDVEEGQNLTMGAIVGEIDASNLALQKEQLSANIEALHEKENDAAPQVAVIEAQMNTTHQQVATARQQLSTINEQIGVLRQQITNLEVEKHRTQNLIAANAATSKQLDDINGQIAVLQRQIEVQDAQRKTQEEQIRTQEQQISVQQRQIAAQQATVSTQNRSILSEETPIQKRIAQLDDQIAKTNITNPLAGTVLVKYANADEVTAMGKPIYKLADLSQMTLRAYISATQLSKAKIGNTVKVQMDGENGQLKTLTGTISWISPRAEFTPKTILTQEERVNLVYAIKVRVANPDGLIKIGMPGEVMF
jgi:HlyD family secretion protein